MGARGNAPAPPGSGLGWDRWRSAAAETGSGAARRLRAVVTRRPWLRWWGRPGRDEIDHACVLEAVARSLRTGQSMAAALAEAAVAEHPRPAAAALARSIRLLEAGQSVAEAVQDWSTGDPSQARGLSAAALGLGAELGGAQARSLDAAASSLRDRASLEREVRSLSSQARASAAVMVLAPLGFAAYTWMTDPRVASVVVGSPIGWGCLGGGAALDGLGALWMAHLAGANR
jgi:tight adherence protein B